MISFRTKAVLSAIFAISLAGTSVPSVIAAPPSRDQYIIKFVDNANADREVESLTNSGIEVAETFRNVFKGAVALMTEAQAKGLSRNPNVQIIEKDGIASIDTAQSSATWGLDRVDQASLPLSTTYDYTSTGTGVKAYVIDTGIRVAHTQFSGRAIWGVNKAGGKNDDCNGHGTHVAGTIGGSTYGVAKNVKLVAVKVLNCQGSGTWSGIISGIDWVVADHKAGELAVANMSLGGGYSASVNAAVESLVSDGVALAVAAGNSNVDACSTSPASATSAITVGATDSSDYRASFSNFGSCLDIFAPGVSITSSWNSSNTSINTISGTSMASPHVAGVIARLLSAGKPASDVLTYATQNKVVNLGTGSPNRLLYISPSN